MTTTKYIDYSVQCQAVFAGASPINGGTMSFNPGVTSRLSPSSPPVIAKEIVFADLVLETGNYNLRIESGDASDFTYNGTDTVVDLTGATVEQFESIDMIYIETNAPATITGLYPTLPGTIDADGVIFVKTNIVGDAITGAGDTVLQLSWTAAAITAITQDKFRARIIILGTL